MAKKINLTHDEFIDAMKAQYGHNYEERISKWGIEACINCSDCKFAGDDLNVLFEFPRCPRISTSTSSSPFGVRCVSKTRKSYGCPAACPRLTEKDKLSIEADQLRERLYKKVREMLKLKKDMQALYQKIADIEAKERKIDEPEGGRA